MIDFTHKLLNQIARDVNNSSIIISPDHNVEIDLSQKWKEIDFMEGLEDALQIKLPVDF